MDSNMEYNNGDGQFDDFEQQSVPNIDFDALEKKWRQIKDEYQKKYPSLKYEDVKVEPGSFLSTLAKIGLRLERSTKEILFEIENWETTKA